MIWEIAVRALKAKTQAVVTAGQEDNNPLSYLFILAAPLARMVKTNWLSVRPLADTIEV